MAARCIQKVFFVIILALLTLNECKVQNVRYKSLGRVFSRITKVLNELNGEVLICNFNGDERILDQIALSLRGEVLFEMRNYKDNQTNVTLDRSALLVFSDIKSLVNFNEKVELTNKSPQKFTFFVYCELCSVEDLQTLRETKLNVSMTIGGFYGFNSLDRSEIIHFQYFIVEEEQARLVRLLTFEWYSPGSCDVQKLVEINRYDMNTRKWKTSNFAIANKFHNFHGCELVFGVEFQVLAMYVDRLPDGTYQYGGLHYDMIISLQWNLNFTAIFNPYNFSSDDFALNRTVDMMLLFGCLNFNYKAKCFLTRPYFFDGYFMAVPPGESYTGYEKLLLPYDLEVWVLIILTFVTAFGTIFILRFAPAKVRHLVIGTHVRTPSLNVGRHFFGVSQVKVPGRNFPRFLAMIFILYSLIIRTAWQSKMFEFMQKEMLKPELKSIYELMNNNYTLYMANGFKIWFNKSDIANYGNIPDYNRNEYLNVLTEKIYNSSCRCGVSTNLRNLLAIAEATRGEFPKRMLKEPFMFEFCGMEIARNNKFYDVFELKTEQLFEGGFFEHFLISRLSHFVDPNYYKKPQLLTKEYLEDIYPKSFPEGPQVLTLVHLEAGFVIWLASISFAFFGFAIEWIRNCIECHLFKLIIESFYNYKRLEARRNKRSVEARVKLARLNISGLANAKGCEPNSSTKTSAEVTRSPQVEIVVEIHSEERLVKQSSIEDIMDEMISLDAHANLAITDKAEHELSSASKI